MALTASHLEAFYAVSQTLNFTRAAANLRLTQSALSQRIINLEEELGTALFIRDRAGLKLTETAFNLVRYCQMKDHLENEFVSGLKNENSKELSGLVRIGGFSSVTASVLVPIVAELIKEHPRIKLQIMTSEVHDLFDLLKRGEIDYMILDDRLDRQELERIHLGKEKNFLAKAKNASVGEVYLDHDEKDETTYQYLKLTKMKLKNIERHYLDNIYGLIEGVKSGLGKAVLPYHILKNEKTIEIVNEALFLEIPVYLYFYSRPYYSKLHEVLIKELKVGFQRRLSEENVAPNALMRALTHPFCASFFSSRLFCQLFSFL